MHDTGTLLYGRKTYQLMVPYWPDMAKNPSTEPSVALDFARAFEAVDQIVVFSQSLDRAEGEKTKIVRTGITSEILKLKEETGKNILVHAGVSFPAQLAALGLIDEYRIVVCPLVLGEGRRLFEGISLQEKLQLKLVESTVFKSGAVALRYLKK
jgi:dihydrofolate reductase